MLTKDIFAILEKNGHFVVTKNGDPIVKETSHMVTEFTDRKDAEKYISILNKLKVKSRN